MAEPAYTVASDSEATGEEKPSYPFHDVAIGIDIGTSHCRVAAWNGSQVELLQNTQNKKLMRSYVTFKDEVPIGGVTNHLSQEHDILTGEAVFNIKRLIGRADTDPVIHASKSLPFLVQTLNIGVRPLIAALVKNMWRSTTPEEVLAIFLIELRLMSEACLRRPVRSVVLTVPVSFSRFQLTRIERACAMAGLQVLRQMPEPTTVALLYAQQQNANENTSNGSEKIAVVFNMGAGFCDVAVAATAGGVSQIKALSGISLGGEDILLNMMRHVFPDMDTHFSTRGADEIRKMGLLRVATHDAIHKLSSESRVEIDVDMGNWGKISRVVDREEFEEVNSEIFGKCEGLIRECLWNAKVGVEELSDAILVGGCSKIPKIRSIVRGVCGREVYVGIDPFEGAVRGAALEGAVASGVNDPFGSLDLLTIQATPHGIGIKADGGKFVPIIVKNSTMPVRREMVFTTCNDDQTEALVVVYEEEDHLLGYFKITGIPLGARGVPEVSVCLDIDASNVLRVFAGVVVVGGTRVVEVRMPNVDDGHGWCGEALDRSYGSALGLATVQKKVLQ